MALLLDARSRGADIGRDREVQAIAATENGYKIYLDDNGTRRAITARFVVNAAGPWANHILDLCDETLPRRNLN